jgi:uncharacterized RDD family membrane protein YckC
MTRNSLEYGVYYASSDYIGVWRRFCIDLVDVVVACTASIAFSAVLILLLSNGDQLAFGLLVVWSSVWFGYFVLLKRSRLRTVGYVLAGARIVNLQGDTPSVPSLVIRMLFAGLGPLNLLFDLFWIPSDPCRQALRDKFAHTYVIRRNASPAGKDRIAYGQYTVLGASYLFQEVQRSQQ